MLTCCCETPLDIGCFPHCGSFELPLIADMTGNHTVRFDWLGASFYFIVEATADEAFEFPAVFNENGCFSVTIEKPDGTLYEIESDDLEDIGLSSSLDGPFDCFKFQVKYTTQLNAPAVSASELSCLMKLTPVEEEFEAITGDTVTITNFVLADATVLNVFENGRLVNEGVGDIDVVKYMVSGQDIVFSADLTGSDITVKGFIEEEFPCVPS